MRKLLILAALAWTLNADPTVQGPGLGYVSSGATVRNVLGIVGAAHLSAPVVSSVRLATVLPGTSVLFAINEDESLVRIDLSDSSSKDLEVADVSAIVASPRGEKVAAIVGDRAHVFGKDGSRVADLALPGAPLLIAISDTGVSLAMSIAETEGEALYVVNDSGSRRLLNAPRLTAFAFLNNSSDFVFSDGKGVVSRFDGNLEFRQLSIAPDTIALAATPDNNRLLMVTSDAIRIHRFASGEEVSLNCKCSAVAATPLGGSNFLLTRPDEGPIWVVDASAEELRLAFIPEAVNE